MIDRFGGIRDVTVSKLLLEPKVNVDETVNNPLQFRFIKIFQIHLIHQLQLVIEFNNWFCHF